MFNPADTHARYSDTLRAIAQPIRAAAWVMTLDPMRRLMDALGNPQRKFRAYVVTGSTGKGTMCLRLASTLQASGLKVGLYTSPHLHLFRERFALLDSPTTSSVGARYIVPSLMITQAELVEVAQPVLAAEQSLDHPFSTFETATALALCWFAQQEIDFAVLEIGIGGRFDAVNVVANDLAVLTPIEAEHVAMLGGSLESVAWHKAGIIQPNGKAVSVPQTPDVLAVLEREAQEKNAMLQIADDPVSSAGDLIDLPAARLSEYPALPGRLEETMVNGRRVIIDGGHTPNAARHLWAHIADVPSIRLMVGMLRDKNVADYLRTFDAPHVHFIYTHARGDRALTPDELLARYRPSQATVTLEPSLDAALAQVNAEDESLWVVAGSLRMAAAAREAFGLLTPDDLAEARLTRAIFEGEDYQKKIKND